MDSLTCVVGSVAMILGDFASSIANVILRAAALLQIQQTKMLSPNCIADDLYTFLPSNSLNWQK